MNRRRLEAPPNAKPYFVSPHHYFEDPPPSSSKLSLTQISHSLALSRFFFRAIAISKFLRPNLSATVWLQSRSFSERLQFRSSILSTAVYHLRKTNQILQNLLQLRDFEVRFRTLRLLQSEVSAFDPLFYNLRALQSQNSRLCFRSFVWLLRKLLITSEITSYI